MKRSAPILIMMALALLLGRENGAALTLEAVLQRTTEKNPKIQKAKLDLERAYGRRLVFHSVGLPDAIVGLVGGLQGGHRAGEKEIQPFGFAYGGFIQPLFNMAVPASRSRGDVEVLIAEQQLNVAMVEQLHAARVAFSTGSYNLALKQIRAQQNEQLQQITSSQKARYEAGLVKRDVFVGAQMQAYELGPRLEAAQRGYDGAILQVSELMGDDLTGRVPLPQLEGDLTFKPVQVDVAAETTRALERRADLKLARLLVRAANEDQRIIEAAYYPALNAVVGGEYIPVTGVRRQSEGSPRRSDDEISSEVRAGAAYTWRVIDNGKVRGAVIRQRSAREINQLTVQKMEADIPRQLARIQNNLEATAQKRASLLSATGAAAETASTIRENLAGGVVSQYEFRMAENASLQIKTTLLNLAYQQHLALAEWDRVTGRYFQFSDEIVQ